MKKLSVYTFLLSFALSFQMISPHGFSANTPVQINQNHDHLCMEQIYDLVAGKQYANIVPGGNQRGKK
jgi:hypothetical protein